MKPLQTITPQTWMDSEETQVVMTALNDKGATQALFVGGCVRNILLGKDVEDIDIATTWAPEEVQKRLEAADIKVIPTGIEHGTVTAVVGRKSFEITTLRKDVETDGRRAVVAFTDDWIEDAQRRDFTINTLLADQAGNIYDPLDCGLEDLAQRRVVFVGDPAQRIAEDALRILRFFRFHAFYGGGSPDADSLKACTAAAEQVISLSKERITQEFFKILSVDDPSEILKTMFDGGILSGFGFPPYQSAFLQHMCQFQKKYKLESLPARLLALVDLDFANVEAIEPYLLIPKVFKKDMEAITKALSLGNLDHDHAVKVAIYKYGRVPTGQAIIIQLIQDHVMMGYVSKALYIIKSWETPHFPVSGQDLLSAGYGSGPDLGRRLEEIEEQWIAAGFDGDKETLLGEIL